VTPREAFQTHAQRAKVLSVSMLDAFVQILNERNPHRLSETVRRLHMLAEERAIVLQMAAHALSLEPLPIFVVGPDGTIDEIPGGES
jgi:hypothetical protein